ncbi:MAG: hypothetical protein C0403_04340 [Desulfobacterium sp.]|nr:hypothetical protein [Desulfobacterium sp.]
MKKSIFFFLFFLLSISIFGCATRMVSISSPYFTKIENEYYYLSITPLSANERHCGFRLILKNKTTKTMILDWNKTYYIHNNERKGSFVFDGVDYENRNNSKRPEKIRAWDIFIKTIWPTVLASGERNQWTQMPMEPGRQGVEVTIVLDGKIFTEKLNVQMSILEK